MRKRSLGRCVSHGHDIQHIVICRVVSSYLPINVSSLPKSSCKRYRRGAAVSRLGSHTEHKVPREVCRHSPEMENASDP